MPTILPQPAGSFDAFGLNLTGYLAQPGSFFTVQRYGFDTGHRKFIVNQDVAEADAFSPGDPDFQYPLMFIDRVTTEIIGGPWAFIDVEYLGLIRPKDTVFSTDTDAREATAAVGLTFYNLQIALTTVQSVYVTDTEPDLSLVGSPLVPGITIPPPDLNGWETAFGLPNGSFGTPLQLWLLERRAIRIVGRPPGYTPAGGGGITGGNFDNTIRPLSGTIHIGYGGSLMNFSGTGTQFNTELQGGNIVYTMVTDPITGASTVNTINQYIVGSILDNTNGIFGQVINPLPVGYDGPAMARGPKPIVFGGGNPVVLYEVTDSFKRGLKMNLLSPYIL